MVLVNCIVLYALLRKNPENLRWLLFGLAISSIISIFAFQNISDEEFEIVKVKMNEDARVLSLFSLTPYTLWTRGMALCTCSP